MSFFGRNMNPYVGVGSDLGNQFIRESDVHAGFSSHVTEGP